MNDKAEKMNLFTKLTGWNKYLYQKCNQNHVIQTQPINQPPCVSDPKAAYESPNSRHYAFATFLKPGHHRFIIYDPLLNRAFCNEFIQDINLHQMFYPELPVYIPEEKQKEKYPPVFTPWIRDTYDRQLSAFHKDTCPRNYNGEPINQFEPSRYIKNQEDIELCETLLMDHFTVIQNFYVEILSRSSKYPEIDLQTLQSQVARIQYLCNQRSDD